VLRQRGTVADLLRYLKIWFDFGLEGFVSFFLQHSEEHGRRGVILIFYSISSQSTAGHRPPQLLAISLDFHLLASSSRQPHPASRISLMMLNTKNDNMQVFNLIKQE
jgi:hypothetical protein